MSLFFHWSACSPPTLRRHRPPSRTTKPSARVTTKEIQIHTLKHENAVERKHNLRLKNVQICRRWRCFCGVLLVTVWTFPLCFYRFKIVLKSTVLANIFVLPTFFGFSGTFTAPIDSVKPDWRLNKCRFDDNLLRNHIWSMFSFFFRLPLWIGSSFTCYHWQRDLWPADGCSSCVCTCWQSWFTGLVQRICKAAV